MKDLAFQSIQLLPNQIKQALRETKRINFPKSYFQVQNIVIAGMGGSAFSYYVTQALFGRKLKIPFLLANDYNLPGFVNEDTLVIASSYSGNTEEMLSCANEAIKKRAKLTAVTSGGKLKELMRRNNLPFYLFVSLFYLFLY